MVIGFVRRYILWGLIVLAKPTRKLVGFAKTMSPHKIHCHTNPITICESVPPKRCVPTKYIAIQIHITKTCLYNFDPLKPHFYIVKLGFAGVYIIFVISAKNINCGYSLEPPRRGGSNEYPQSMFSAEI